LGSFRKAIYAGLKGSKLPDYVGDKEKAACRFLQAAFLLLYI